MKYLVALFIIMATYNTQGNTLIIPTWEKYQDFLVDEWKPHAPNIIVFKDPHCGFCIKALNNMQKYKDYNVFMFWSPILGKASSAKVDSIFECNNPVGSQVISSVVNRRKISCDATPEAAEQRKFKRQLNFNVVENYNPQSVPSYYFGGQKVYLSSLTRFRQEINNNISSVQLNWPRYKALKVNQVGHKGLANALLFIPWVQSENFIEDVLKKDLRYNWYTVSANCEENKCIKSKQGKLSQELKLMFDIKELSSPLLIINSAVVNPIHYKKYLSPSLIKALEKV